MGIRDSAAAKKNVRDFSRTYDLLPVTTSASATMSASGRDKDLQPFLPQLALSELYPVGRTSCAADSAHIKKRIGQAVDPTGSAISVLGQIQSAAVTADSARP